MVSQDIIKRSLCIIHVMILGSLTWWPVLVYLQESLKYYPVPILIGTVFFFEQYNKSASMKILVGCTLISLIGPIMAFPVFLRIACNGSLTCGF